MLPLYDILKAANVTFHSYADDTQFYIETNINTLDNAKQESQKILHLLKNWLDSHKLKMNSAKTEIILLGSDKIIELVFDNVKLKSKHTVRNLGVMIDNKLTFNEQVNQICRDCYISLRNISKKRNCMDSKSCKIIVNALVLSKLNFCCTLLLGLPTKQIKKLQKIQNYAAKVIAHASKFDHVSPILKSLKWLNIENIITFRYCTIVYKCLNNAAPLYLSNLLHLLYIIHVLDIAV